MQMNMHGLEAAHLIASCWPRGDTELLGEGQSREISAELLESSESAPDELLASVSKNSQLPYQTFMS